MANDKNRTGAQGSESSNDNSYPGKGESSSKPTAGEQTSSKAKDEEARTNDKSKRG